jgi:hypothetical protein
MKALLNIGLAIGSTSKLDPADVLRVLALREFDVVMHDVHRSETEDTLVVGLAAAPVWASVYGLSQSLAQDAIAVWYPDTFKGDLIGPRAEAWGTFNPAYFLGLDGQAVG